VTTVIVDTSAIPAIFDEAYQEHPRIEIIADHSVALVLSPLVVTEADDMLYSRLGADAATRAAGKVGPMSKRRSIAIACGVVAVVTVMTCMLTLA
jgi:predicted nucleic acid-binding protein